MEIVRECCPTSSSSLGSSRTCRLASNDAAQFFRTLQDTKAVLDAELKDNNGPRVIVAITNFFRALHRKQDPIAPLEKDVDKAVELFNVDSIHTSCHRH